MRDEQMQDVLLALNLERAGRGLVGTYRRVDAGAGGLQKATSGPYSVTGDSRWSDR